MHLPIIISRFSNLLFFIQRTNQGRSVDFDLQKHLDDNLDMSFYGKSESEIWKQINKSIGKQNVEQFKEAIIPIKPIFDSYWGKASKNLSSLEKCFQDNNKLFEQIIFDIQKLNGVKDFSVSKIPIYLVSDPKSNDEDVNAWFSWTPEHSFVVVEIPSDFKVTDNLFQIGILAHEYFHLVLKQNNKLVLQINQIVEENNELLKKVLKKGVSDKMFFEELLVSSFIPEGYLSEKYLNLKVADSVSNPKDLLDWRRLVAFEMRKLAEEYLNDSRQIDKEYLNHLIGVIKQNTK